MAAEEAAVQRTRYGYSVETNLQFDQAITKVTEELAQDGFGILTRIDVRATLKEKLDVDFRPYVILGACNPRLASIALSEETEVGLLMPCNVIVYQNDAGGITVSFLSPRAQFGLIARADLASLMDEADDLIRGIAKRMI